MRGAKITITDLLKKKTEREKTRFFEIKKKEKRTPNFTTITLDSKK